MEEEAGRETKIRMTSLLGHVIEEIRITQTPTGTFMFEGKVRVCGYGLTSPKLEEMNQKGVPLCGGLISVTPMLGREIRNGLGEQGIGVQLVGTARTSVGGKGKYIVEFTK